MLCVPLRPPRLFFLLYIKYNFMCSSKCECKRTFTCSPSTKIWLSYYFDMCLTLRIPHLVMHTQPSLSTRPSYHRINSDAGRVCRCIGPLCKTMVGMLGYKSYGSGSLKIIISRLLKFGYTCWSHRPPGTDPATPPDTTPAGVEELLDH